MTPRVFACLVFLAAAWSATAHGFQSPKRGLRQTGADDDSQVAPASIGADVPITYFGPAPSEVQRELIGPFQLLKSGTLNVEASPATISLPLYRGKTDDGAVFWYIVTDTTDAANAAALGINHVAKLRYAEVPGAVREGRLDNRLMLLTKKGVVDFEPERVVVPGDAPNYFPPKEALPGSKGVDGYSPLVKIGSEIYNAPIIASDVGAEFLSKFCNGIPESGPDEKNARKFIHDSVVAICPEDEGIGGTVTLELINGFSFGRPILYLSTEATMLVPAALEKATYSPALARIPFGADDSLFSAVERLFAMTNGHTNGDINIANRDDGPGETAHPTRQGFNSALRGDGFPLNVLGGIPTIATDYSPLWDVNLGEWTEYAVENQYRVRLLEEFQILGLVERGFITGPGGVAYGSAGFLVNCPIVHRFL